MQQIFSDPSFLGSLLGSTIEALATLVAVAVAILVAVWQISLAKKQFKDQLKNTQLEMKLASYENLVSSERHLIGLLSGDQKSTSTILEHFGLKNIPDEVSEQKLLLFVILQISTYESIYYRFEKGVFPNDLWPQWNASMANSFNEDSYFREVWKESDLNKFLYKPFVEHVDKHYYYVNHEFKEGI